MKTTKRLQRKEWYDMKEKLTMINYIVNSNNHIKGFYKDNKGNVYTHWLNDEEIKILKGSDK